MNGCSRDLLDLHRRNPRAADAVHRAGGREAAGRARLLVLLHSLTPAPGAAVRRDWYEAGAFCRASIPRLRALWRRHFKEEAPCERTLGARLRWCEAARLIARAPGNAAGQQGRDGDTVHIIISAAEGRWWARRGAFLLVHNPAARHDRGLWLTLFGGWRRLAVEFEQRLQRFRAVLRRARAHAHGLSMKIRDAVLGGSMADLRATLAARGCVLKSGWRFRFWQQEERARAAVAHLLAAVKAGREPRDKAGWMVKVWKSLPAAAHLSLADLRKQHASSTSVLASLGLEGLFYSEPAARLPHYMR